MKQYIRSLISTFSLLLLLCSINPVSATTTNEIETVFNWAENNFPQFFPNPQATQMIDPWAFRFYPSTGIYIGVNNNDLFVFGGPWGTESPTFIAALPDVLAQIQATNGDGSVPACSNTVELPQGISITQSGNVVNVATDGCIEIPNPENTNFCEPPAPDEPTGISVLSTINVTSFQTTGITIDLPPGIPSPLDSFAQTTSNCVNNAEAEAPNRVVNSNICLNMTSQFASQPNLPGISINPPVTVEWVSTSTSQQVSDCFATNATTIVDAFTGESWVNVNGNFVQTGF